MIHGEQDTLSFKIQGMKCKIYEIYDTEYNIMHNIPQDTWHKILCTIYNTCITFYEVHATYIQYNNLLHTTTFDVIYAPWAWHED